ncbi:MAG: DUF2924 domain-containing protein [Phycisphaeraceae bacterium]
MPEPEKGLNINAELAAMARMTPKQLRARYLEVFGEPTRSGNRRFMIKRIAWRMQANAEGDIEQRMKRIRARAMELARDSDLRTTAPKRPQPPVEPNASRTVERTARFAAADELTPGTQITRPYKGQTIVVTVLTDGFEHGGQKYRSLTAIAEAVTGTHVSGRAFFRLNQKKEKRS